MTRSKLLIIGLGMAMVMLFAGPAAAQDDPAISVDPDVVESAGTYQITVTGTGYTEPTLFVLPCSYPEGGDLSLLTVDDCDLEALMPVTVDEDGTFEFIADYDVPAEGMAIVAADGGQVETAAALVEVGATDDPQSDELPDTGSETVVFVIVGLTLAAAGLVVIQGSRRLA